MMLSEGRSTHGEPLQVREALHRRLDKVTTSTDQHTMVFRSVLRGMKIRKRVIVAQGILPRRCIARIATVPVQEPVGKPAAEQDYHDVPTEPKRMVGEARGVCQAVTREIASPGPFCFRKSQQNIR